MAIEVCPARGILRVVGYERAEHEELAAPATLPRELTVERIAA
jgi:hypothetical protein